MCVEFTVTVALVGLNLPTIWINKSYLLLEKNQRMSMTMKYIDLLQLSKT